VIRNFVIVGGFSTLLVVSVGSLASAMMVGYAPSHTTGRGSITAAPDKADVAMLCALKKPQYGFAAIRHGCEPTARDQ